MPTGVYVHKNSGESNGNWKGGSRTPEYERRYALERRHRLGISKRYMWESKATGRKVYKRDGKIYGEGWPEIRKTIYERDNWVCQECGIKCRCHGDMDKIQCHHIDYNVCNNNPNNLVTLCASCHGKTNFKREDWTTYYRKKGCKNHARS